VDRIYRIGAAAVLLLALLSPAMACVLPSHSPTAEAACCKRMNGDCSAMQMPASQQCCQMTAHSSPVTMAQPQSVPLAADTAELAVVPVPIPCSTPHTADRIPHPYTHPVPILRI
jgi:hypothetical protein